MDSQMSMNCSPGRCEWETPVKSVEKWSTFVQWNSLLASGLLLAACVPQPLSLRSHAAEPAALSGVVPPRRPADFKPYRYPFATEELRARFSEAQMRRAAAAVKEMTAVNEKGPWKPIWESLDKHRAPEWFSDAKLGVFINWGLHSVPAWATPSKKARYPDAYGTWMYTDDRVRAHHAQFWGPDFQFDDFFPLFTADRYDPEAMVQFLHDCGVRYIVPMCKHHDGVAWWDSAWTKRNFAQLGPKRDLLMPLAAAARKRDMKLGLYLTWREYATVAIGPKDELQAMLFDLDKTPTVPFSEANRRRMQGQVPVRDIVGQYLLPLGKEMVDRFDPDYLWMDGEWRDSTERLRSRELAAYFYNKNAGRKEACVNDRYGKNTRIHHGDVFCSEYHTTKSLSHAWEECRGIGHAFAHEYEEEQDEQLLGTAADLIYLFVDVISQNGNLNLVVGPDASGQFPKPLADRLKALGRWINVNAEAVYGTRALEPYEEGSVRFTGSKDGRFAYAILKQWPGKRLVLKGIRAAEGTTLKLLGVGKPLAWEHDGKGLSIRIPDSLQNEKNRPCQHAWVVKITRQSKSGGKAAAGRVLYHDGQKQDRQAAATG
jgi:alpha-L-fucosidase